MSAGPGVPFIDVDAIVKPIGDEPPQPPAQQFPDLVDSYLPALGTHILAGAQNSGKTAFTTWMLAELKLKGAFLGHKGYLPSWVRVFVFDRTRADWVFWCKQAGIECPQGYWVLDDKTLDLKAIRGWKDYQKVIDFWEAKLKAMNPEPGGLIITDGGLDLVGDGTTKYFDAYANMLAVQRITQSLKLTHFMICHAGKPKMLGNRDAKARDIDKANMSAGGLASADTLSYISCAAELAEVGEDTPSYQRFTWVPHHAPGEEAYLARIEGGMFKQIPKPLYEEKVRPQRKTKAEEERDERAKDLERARKYIPLILGDEDGKCLLAAKVAQILQTDRFGDKIGQTRAYATINAAKDNGIARAGDPDKRMLYLIEAALEGENA